MRYTTITGIYFMGVSTGVTGSDPVLSDFYARMYLPLQTRYGIYPRMVALDSWKA